jgi:hypothetical protein
MLAVIKKLFKNFFFLFLLQNSLKFMEKKEKYFFLTVKMAAKKWPLVILFALVILAALTVQHRYNLIAKYKNSCDQM